MSVRPCKINPYLSFSTHFAPSFVWISGPSPTDCPADAVSHLDHPLATTAAHTGAPATGGYSTRRTTMELPGVVELAGKLLEAIATAGGNLAECRELREKTESLIQVLQTLAKPYTPEVADAMGQLEDTINDAIVIVEEIPAKNRLNRLYYVSQRRQTAVATPHLPQQGRMASHVYLTFSLHLHLACVTEPLHNVCRRCSLSTMHPGQKPPEQAGKCLPKHRREAQ